jgi:DNA-binding MarR family transcriptional regulator
MKNIPLGVKIKCINSKIEQKITEKMKEQELTAAQAQLLRHLYHGERMGEDVNISVLSAKMQQSHVTVRGLVERLEQKGFVETKPGESDKRCRRVNQTEKAVWVHGEIEACGKAQEEKLLDGFTEEEKVRLYEYLDRLWENAKKL